MKFYSNKHDGIFKGDGVKNFESVPKRLLEVIFMFSETKIFKSSNIIKSS